MALIEAILCFKMNRHNIHSGILLSQIKKRNSVICSEVDGPRVCHTEWSKSEGETLIQYANTYIWNLKKKKKKWF